MSNTGPATALNLPDGRKRVLYCVRRRGEATAEDVAEQLAITVSGARQHLSALLAEGMVEAHEEQAEVARRGRKTLVYRVSSVGDSQFPKAYGELTNELLGYLDAEEPGVVDRLFERRRQARVVGAKERLARRRSLEGRVDELTHILDDDGYLASWESTGPGVYLIVEHNCAIWAVAQRYGQSCTTELAFIREVLPETTVERVRHMIAGAPHCAYEVRAP
jgi:DeoR family suf operon transcriptional repressor